MPQLNITTLSSNLSTGPESGNLYRPFSVFSVLTLTLLAMLVVATFVWNLLVLVTILRVRTFHRVPHNLVASMAISDVMVAGLVMPLSLVRELYGRRWILGRILCQVWISCDVLCCTASIWNVTAIALDRYWSITRHLEYTLKTRKRISNVMIGLTWLLSSVISLSPLFGWGETYSEEALACQVSQEPFYTVFSTFGAFYLPLCVVLFVYWKIYKAAKFRIGSRKTNTIMPMAEVIEVGSVLWAASCGQRPVGSILWAAFCGQHPVATNEGSCTSTSWVCSRGIALQACTSIIKGLGDLLKPKRQRTKYTDRYGDCSYHVIVAKDCNDVVADCQFLLCLD
ncbi:hypothetical protein NFI96_006216 [Prochilodus magdalenae]|nr:hypothetical protein NFI96_006216 [Prochilodus magdalenae]